MKKKLMTCSGLPANFFLNTGSCREFKYFNNKYIASFFLTRDNIFTGRSRDY